MPELPAEHRLRLPPFGPSPRTDLVWASV